MTTQLCWQIAAAAGLTATLTATAVAAWCWRACAQAREDARTDPLTGLLSSAAWQAAAATVLARAARTGEPVTVAMLDIDNFKAVNDTHGHLAGDRLLTAAAAAIRARLRTGDHAGRLGGDEFAIIFPATTARQAEQAIRRLCAGIPAAGRGHGSTGTVTVSIGISGLTGPAWDLRTLLAAADSALYQAKRAGRARVQVS